MQDQDDITDAPQFPTLCNLTTPCALGSGTETGRLAGVGKVSATGQVAIRFLSGDDFNTAGQATLTTKGGTLAVAFIGSGHVTSVGAFVVGSTTESTVTEHILAGTGRFVGVTGTATADQKGTLTAINLGTDCIGAPQSPCLQFTSVDSSIWHDLVLNR